MHTTNHMGKHDPCRVYSINSTVSVEIDTWQIHSDTPHNMAVGCEALSTALESAKRRESVLLHDHDGIITVIYGDEDTRGYDSHEGNLVTVTHKYIVPSPLGEGAMPLFVDEPTDEQESAGAKYGHVIIIADLAMVIAVPYHGDATVYTPYKLWTL